MKITKILPLVGKDWVKIWVDGKFFGLVSIDAVVTKGLAVEKELTTEELFELKLQETVKRFIELANLFLSYRPRSVGEVVIHLRKKGAEEDVVDMVVENLIKSGLLDDRKFIHWFLEQRAKFRPRGLIVIKKELFVKRVKPDLIDEVFGEIESSNFELAMARQAAEKYGRKKIKVDKKEFKQKLFNYLRRLGFGYEVIKAIVDEAG